MIYTFIAETNLQKSVYSIKDDTMNG